MIIKSCTSGFSGGGRRELTGLLCNFLETQVNTSVADHPFATNWPKYWATSVGAWTVDADGQSVCMCVYVHAFVSVCLFWQCQCQNNNISYSMRHGRIFQCHSHSERRAKQTFFFLFFYYVGAFQLIKQIHSEYPAEKLKLRRAVRKHHEPAQTCLCVPFRCCGCTAVDRMH